METFKDFHRFPSVTTDAAKILWSIVVLICVSTVPVIDSQCTFPSALTGTWVRSRDAKSLTFSSSDTVAGLAVLYNTADIGDFTCNTLSSGRYIIASGSFSTDFGTNIYYMCWQFVQVSDNSFIMYELSDDLMAAGYDVRPGVTQSSMSAVNVATICPQSTSTKLFTTLVKSGASESDVASTCPTALQANFRYDSCTSASLQSCTNTKQVTADYAVCSTQVFSSTGGAVSCMGSATFSGDRYVNLYLHDAGNSIICWKIPDTSSAGDMSTTYYSGDCTTTAGSSTNLNLVFSSECTEDSGEDGGGGGGGSAGAIAGGAVGGILAIVIIVLIVYILLRKNNVQQVSAKNDSPREEKSDKKAEKPETIEISMDAEKGTKALEETPAKPQGLPPLKTNGTVAPGEPLRG
ncbi:hypothetical protein PoB_000151800 [Plakobranchus ocellatus]|uniref:Uncharacterized protein n=1 Tax=Plakobranchus ocellatus TaxID=259542 RepID=A0AAV3XXN0_9GAST|nr:hypothetical protein PoB_000151800 [Plakobranchus ocellatus]